MQLDPALAEILASLDPSAETPVEEMTPEDARATWKEEMAAVGPARRLPVKSVSIARGAGAGRAACGPPLRAGGGRMRRVLPILVYYHGGGWIRGDLDTHDDVCRYLCHHAGCLVASVDYRLAPEHRFPRSVGGLRRRDPLGGGARREPLAPNPARLAIGGDSAGRQHRLRG